MNGLAQTTINYRELRGLWPRWFSFDFFGNPDDHIFKAVSLRRCFYELDLLKELSRRISPLRSGIAIDVGANIGNHSLFFAKVLRRRTICVEPFAPARTILSINLGKNDADCEILPIGVSDRETSGSIVAPQSGNIGQAKLSQGKGDVPISTLDAICAGKAIDLIKIDTEGMEISVLRGARGTITRCKPIITAEASDDASRIAIFDFLFPLGYVARGPFAWTPTYIFEVMNVG